VPKIARLQQEIYVPCMAFFNYVHPWPETTHWPRSPLMLSAGRRDAMPPFGRADFGPEISCGATCFICAPRPAVGALSHRPKRLAQNAILAHYGLVLNDRNLAAIKVREIKTIKITPE
jgi:hypothetical protein